MFGGQPQSMFWVAGPWRCGCGHLNAEGIEGIGIPEGIETLVWLVPDTKIERFVSILLSTYPPPPPKLSPKTGCSASSTTRLEVTNYCRKFS